MYGLPLAEGIEARLYFDKEGFIISAAGQIFTLGYDVVTDVCIKTDVEISKQYVSSSGGAVGGAMLFGPIGAVIGGRVKEKNTSVTTEYIIVTYAKNNEFNYLCFELSVYGTECTGNCAVKKLADQVRKKVEGNNAGQVFDLSADMHRISCKQVSDYKPDTDIMAKALAAEKRSRELKKRDKKFSRICFLVLGILALYTLVICTSLTKATEDLADDTASDGEGTSVSESYTQ